MLRSLIKSEFSYLLLIAVMALSLFYYAVPHDLIFTDDSYQYQSAARSYAESGDFRSPDGSVYTYWPPLFPMVLAGLSALNISLKTFHAFLYLPVIGLLWALSSIYIHAVRYRLLWVGIVVVNVHTVMISVFYWSEWLFFCLMLFNWWIFMHRFQWKYWAMAFILSGFLLCLQRSAGFFWMAGMGLSLALDEPGSVKQWIKSLLYNGLAVSGLLTWLILKSTDSDAGFDLGQHQFLVDFFPNLVKLAMVSGLFFVPLNGWSWFVYVPIGLGLVMTRGWKSTHVRLIVIFIAVYLFGFGTMQRLDPGEIDRYLSVIYPLFLLLMVVFTERSGKKWALVLLLFWMVYPISRTAINLHRWHHRSSESAEINQTKLIKQEPNGDLDVIVYC